MKSGGAVYIIVLRKAATTARLTTVGEVFPTFDGDKNITIVESDAITDGTGRSGRLNTMLQGALGSTSSLTSIRAGDELCKVTKY
jgi:hypothetical protein